VPSTLSVVMLSKGFGTPLSISGVTGQFGLDATLLLILGSTVHDPSSGQAIYNFPTPNDPNLKNVRVTLQSLVVDLITVSMALTNTAELQLQ
jgi:hypothetical protein